MDWIPLEMNSEVGISMQTLYWGNATGNTYWEEREKQDCVEKEVELWCSWSKGLGLSQRES